METEQEVYELITRSLTDSLTREEKGILDTWKNKSEENLTEYLDFVSIWNVGERLSSNEDFNVIQALREIRKRAGIQNRKWNSIWPQIAAVLLLSVIFAGLFTLLNKPQPTVEVAEIIYQEIKSTYGTQTSLKLADGTTVYLNSGSTLRFPVYFHDMETRRVELTGEGYFVVTENPSQPFIVAADSLLIEVRGTRFNVDAYHGNNNITVALVEGEVRLLRETVKGTRELTVLTQGEVATLNEEGRRLYVNEYASLNKYFAWTEGKIVFEDDPIQVVVEKLSNWYNIDIEISDRQLQRYRFTGTFINEPVEQILSILSITSPMSYSITPSVRLQDNSFSRRKVILKSK